DRAKVGNPPDVRVCSRLVACRQDLIRGRRKETETHRMAHAGTPTGLAQQAGAAQPWKTMLAAIAVLAIGLALGIAVMFANNRAVAPETGRDDGMIEAQRDATLMSGEKAPAGAPAI